MLKVLVQAIQLEVHQLVGWVIEFVLDFLAQPEALNLPSCCRREVWTKLCSHTSGTFCWHSHMCVFTGVCTSSLVITLNVMKLQLLTENRKLPDAMSISNL